MHRFQIGLIAAGVLLVTTVVVYSGVSSRLNEAAEADAELNAKRAASALAQMSRLDGLDLAMTAAKFAGRENFPQVFAEANETERRKAAFMQAEAIQRLLEAESRRAAIVAVLDKAGKVVARDLNPNAMYGEDLSKKPVVQEALAGHASKDIWTEANRMTRIAVAPIEGNNGVLGALLVGYVMSHQEARKLATLAGAEVAVFYQGKVQTSSFVTEEGKEDGGKGQAVSEVLFSNEKLAEQALSKGSTTEVQHVNMDGQTYAVAATPLPGNFSDKSSGLAALVPEGGSAAAKAIGARIWLLGLVGLLAVAFAAAMTARRFVRPLDEVEVGVAEIINGNIDYTFKPVGPDFEGLSNGLNVMLARLLGRDDPDEDQVEEEEGTKWKAEQMVIEEGDGQVAGVDAQALAQESEAAYYPRLFNEYVTALRNSGVRADGVSVQSFTAKLRLAEGGLKRKWKCRMVRFVMVASGANIVFRAVKIA